MTRQRLFGLRIRHPVRDWRRQTPLPMQGLQRSKGFSLVELLIVAGLTAVVLAGLGALTLVTDVQAGRRSDSIQEAREQWGRAVNFIQSEVADAATLSDTFSGAYPCTPKPTPSPILVLEGPKNPTNPAWIVIYGVRSRLDGENGLYRGPKLLVRCGPLPLAADRNPPDRPLTAIYGNIDETKVASPTETVLLDRLPDNNPLTVLPLVNPDKFLDPAKRLFLDAQLTIRIKAGTEKDGTDITYAGDQPFRVHVQRTPSIP